MDNEKEVINVYQMYLDELADIPQCTEEEVLELATQLQNGNFRVAGRLVEGNLHRVLPIAAQIHKTFKEVQLDDLIQEGNVALTMAVGDYSDGGYGSFIPYIEKEIRGAMMKIIGEENMEAKVQQEVLSRVKRLEDATEGLAKLYGRAATTAELADFMKMTEDEVKEIAQITLNILTKPDVGGMGMGMGLDPNMLDEAGAASDDDDLTPYLEAADNDNF